MSWKRVSDSVYVVSWDDLGIVKVGYSARQRWRKFRLRGARVVLVQAFASLDDASDVESRVHAALRRHRRPAFASADEAAACLGAGGSGWAECYLLPAAVAEQAVQAVLRPDAGADADA